MTDDAVGVKVRTSPAADAGRPRTAKATSVASVVGATGLGGGILCSGFELGKEKVLRMRMYGYTLCVDMSGRCMGIEGHGVPHVEFSSTAMFMEVSNDLVSKLVEISPSYCTNSTY